MFEPKHHPLLPLPQFIRRMVYSTLSGLGIVALSLTAGMLGYHHFEDQSWPDAFVNAAMILSGMGPLSEPHSTASKIFAGCYALYSGLALITIAGIIFAPAVHRFLHRFHLEGR
jgi:hypothetical protein